MAVDFKRLARGSTLGLAAAVGFACATAGTVPETHRCYPYLPQPSGVCRTHCTSIDDCAGSRGPADFAENGWPLDCINERCVPLPPEAVELD